MKAVCYLTLAVALALPSLLQARTWTEAGSGRTLEGDFVKVDGDEVVIRRSNGSTVNVSLEKLSEADQTFVSEQAAATNTSETATIPEGGVVLSKVHLCCGGCEKGVDKALADVEGVDYTVDRDAETITFAGDSVETIEEALTALASKGYYGESNSETLKIADVEASEDGADSVEVSGVHLCCGACVKAVTRALEDVEGYESHDAAKNSETFVVKGKDVSPAAVLTALRAEGLSGTVK